MTTLRLWSGQELREAFNAYFGVEVPNGSGGQVLGDMADVMNARMGIASDALGGALRFALAFEDYFGVSIEKTPPIDGLILAAKVLADARQA